MHTVKRSVLLPYSCEQMFDLVAEVEKYPEFMPWCGGATVNQRDEKGMEASVTISIAGIRQTFTTRNEHVPGREVRLHLVNGPFSQLEGVWTFTPVGEGDQRACRIDLKMDYGFSNRLLATLVGLAVCGVLVVVFALTLLVLPVQPNTRYTPRDASGATPGRSPAAAAIPATCVPCPAQSSTVSCPGTGVLLPLKASPTRS